MRELDQFLDSLDPARTLNEVRRRADEAVNSFPLDAGAMSDWWEFERTMAAFYGHLETHLLRLPTSRPVTVATGWARCCAVLSVLYGRQGEMKAFANAQSGLDGGLYSVLKKVAEHMAAETAGNEINARTASFLASLTAKEQIEAAEVYRATWGHLLPPELVSGRAVELKMHLHQVLAEHPRMLQRLRQAGR